MKKVVLVDDDPTYLSLLGRAVKMDGLGESVVLAGSGQEYRRYLEEKAEDYGLALLDVNLHDGETGFDLLTWTRQQFPQLTIPTILHSWTVHPADEQKALDLGARLEPKVSSFAILRQKLREWLALANEG